MSTIDNKEVLISDIEAMKNGSYEQMMLVTFYSLSSYFKSLFAFGSKSDVTRDNLNVIKEMFSILKKERMLLNYILKNLDKFELTAVEDVIDTLDKLNDNTVLYYYDVINEIEDACEMSEERRGIRPRKDFPTLIQTESYANSVKCLGLNKENIKEFLGYPQEFWDFIKNKDSYGDRFSDVVSLGIAYVEPFVSDNILIDFKMYIPEVSSLETALLAIRMYEKAFYYYRNLNKPYIQMNEPYTKEEHFEEEYLPGIQIKK